MEGNDVKFRGVDIGSVESITVEPGGDAVRISLEIDAGVDLAPDAVAIIAPESLFGDWQAEIVTKTRFPTFEYFPIEEEAVEDGRRVLAGYALPDISRLTAAADDISKSLAVITDRIEETFNEETAENLQLAVSNMQQISEQIKDLIEQQAATFENVSAEVERTATEITGAAITARSTLERADQLLGSGGVDSILVNMQNATRDLSELAGNVNQATDDFDQTLARVDSTFANISEITARVQRGEGTLGMLIADSALYLRAAATMTQLDSLLADFRANPRRYINLSIF
jgi:phospholipid/cholesterol/gamma-HCH transport system substrate-binding protein